MIASWMLYALAVGALVVIAALVIERVAIAKALPIRFVWVAVLALASLLPLVNTVRDLLPHESAPIPLMPFVVTMPAVTVRPAAYDWTLAVDRGLEAMWVTLSILLLVRIVWAVVGLRRSRLSWPVGEVDGTRVRFASNVGPAVVGLRSMDVVLPEWIVALDAPLRAIVLKHENEHRRARDPYLLFAAALAVALMPWNPALWFAARRLRLAIEIDCDQRVLRAHPSPERYGMLMLTIAQRRGVAPTLFAPMLSESATQLERRIVAMRSTTRRLARGTAIAATAMAVGVLAFACSLQSDNPTSPKPADNASASKAPVFTEFKVSAEATPAAGNPAPRYPDELRKANVQGSVIVQFVVDTSGHADMNTLKVLHSTDDAFTTSVRMALPNMRFTPAMVEGNRKVKQLLQMPFEFALGEHLPQNASRLVSTSSKQQVRALQPVVITGVTDAQGAANHIAGRAAAAKRVLPHDVYYEYQVEKAVSPVPGNPAPRYPDALRSANVEGEVLAQFIVDENGRPDMSSFGVLKSSDSLFTQTVLTSLPNMRFNAAQIGGRPVKQLVQMPFQFNLSKR